METVEGCSSKNSVASLSEQELIMIFNDNYKINYGARTPHKATDQAFFKRWSPRSFKKSEIPEYVTESIFDAARWSPSCFNSQPWLFITSDGAENFDLFLSLLSDNNQRWAKNASVIGFILARRRFEHNENINSWSNFDCGTAWMALTMQARMHGLYTHGMAGIKKNEVYKTLGIPEESYEVICGFVIGVVDTPDKLPDDLKNREFPKKRKNLHQIWKKNTFL
jgi:nitroreductase